MTAILIDGKALSHGIQVALKKIVSRQSLAPCLAVVLVGSDPASEIYVSKKQAACEAIGIQSKRYALPEAISENELLSLLDRLNADQKTHGILVQLPLPKHIDVKKVIARIAMKKDVDGFHPDTLGKLQRHEKALPPCTASAILQLLQSINCPLSGKKAAVIGQSMIVGQPTSVLLELAGCQVTRCDVKTNDIITPIKEADIVVVAIGKPGLIKGEWIKPGAVVIDVGINRLEDGSIVGDVEFDEAVKKAAYITPVPGGVGPMTVACLMQNTVEAAC